MIRMSFFLRAELPDAVKEYPHNSVEKRKEEIPVHRGFLFSYLYPIYIIGIILLLQQLLPVLYLFCSSSAYKR